MNQTAIMQFNKNGDDLMNTFNQVNIDMRHLSPNVIRAWFDTDCHDIKEFLSWISMSLSGVNYVSPLEQAEFKNIKGQIDTQKLPEELKKLNSKYLDVLDDADNTEDILILEEELLLLEEENDALDNLIKTHEQLDHNLSLEVTLKTRKEIETGVEWKKLLQSCKILSSAVDDCNNKITIDSCDPDTYLTNLIDLKEYRESMENLGTLLTPYTDVETFSEKSDEFESLELEVCKKRILHSQQIYLANCVETEKLRDVLQFLNTVDLRGTNFSLPNNTEANAKEVHKKIMCNDLDSVAAKLTKHYLKQAQLSYIYLLELEENLEKISSMSENVSSCLSYYVITISLLVEEQKDIELLENFYRKIDKHARDVLRKSHIRTEKMRAVIKDHDLYRSKPPSDRSKLISSIGKILSSGGRSLQSIADTACKFKNDLQKLESQIFCPNLRDEKERISQINEDIRTLRNFLTCGPTNRVILVPFELQKLFFKVEDHLGEESDALDHAMDIREQATKSMTKAQNYTRDLWISFITNPSRLGLILQQAEDDFKQRTQQYF